MTPRLCGTWPSPITAATVAAQGLRLTTVAIDGGDIYWLEGRPFEGGRHVLVRRTADGSTHDLTPPGFNVRTRAHEYGGGAFVVHRGVVFFSNFSDQRLYALTNRGGTAAALTPEGDWCYADGVVDAGRQRLICVREDRTNRDAEPVNALVAVALEGDGHVRVVASGYDFYSTPRISADGRFLSWLCWNHPQMPWDGTELWVAEISTLGTLERAWRVAGSSEESIYQPGWSPDGALYFVSDRSGWWQLYRLDSPLDPGGTPRAAIKHPPEAEFGRAHWDFGTKTWVSAGPGRLVVSYTTRGRWRLATVDVATGSLADLAVAIEPHQWLAANDTHVVLVGSSTAASSSVVRIHLDSGRVETLRPAEGPDVPAGCISQPEAVECPSMGGRCVHAFYYPPANGNIAPPERERPPLIAISHGGPTTATSATLDLRVQYWTSRGFAVVDVNYGGSTGYGRAYRERLKGAWGIVDVEDVIGVVRHLVSEGKADADRLIIRGGSAGGYTTLAALTFHPDVFRAGASYYGVSDLEALARDTHKFESRYLDTLVGPYPAMRDEYWKRSPINFTDRLSCALILFQGLEDRVVPPDQSASMAEAVRRKGLPVEYLTFPGEQHGFRRAETIARCLEAELDFYGVVFGFEPADVVGPRRTRRLGHEGHDAHEG